MNIYEKKYTSATAVRTSCIKLDWYDAGTNEDYAKLLDMAEWDNVDNALICAMATDIVKHTSRYEDNDIHRIENVMYLLNREAVTTLFTII